MNVAALREFLRSLPAGLSGFGVPPKCFEEMNRVCEALGHFQRYTLAEFAELVLRADEYHRGGAVTPAESQGFAALRTATGELSAMLARHPLPADGAAGVAEEVAAAKTNFTKAVEGLATHFGFKAALTVLKKGASKGRGSRQVKELSSSHPHAQATIDELKELALKAETPGLVEETDIKAAMSKVKAHKFKPDDLKYFAKEVAGMTESSGPKALLAIEAKLRGPRRFSNSQED